ncbi:MAG: bifunctional shikimate kinase/3-dehydroquinate synthase [Actinomycetota bacterium]
MSSRPVVLIGLPASGKSTIGRLVARSLGRRFVDLDDAIEARAGRAVGDIFAADGEDAFRRLETEALAEALTTAGADAPVIAAGGGVVVTEANRRLLIGGPLTVWLDLPLSLLVARAGRSNVRPLLDGDPAARLARLRQERLNLYTVTAEAIVADDGTASADDMAARVVAEIERRPSSPMLTEPVHLDDGRSYPVLVGPGVTARLPSVLPDGVKRLAVVTQEGIGVDIDPGVEHRVFHVPDGEQAKQLDEVGRLASAFARWGLTRRDAVLGVGGGVVTDLAGFVAATYHRGLPVLHLSTTLLGQIDAAIGGKCGVNLPEGKNLVGAFKQPTAVLCDTATLSSLPGPDFTAGLGELAKYHFLTSSSAADASEAAASLHLDRLPLAERVAACVRIKADVVADDETEGGRRAILNYGHTLGHSLEAATGFRIRHGQAVAVGLIYAAELAAALGRIDRARVAEHRRVVTGYGLPTTIPTGLDPDELVEGFTRDKKALDGITFVLDGADGVEPVPVEDRELLRATLATVTPERER